MRVFLKMSLNARTVIIALLSGVVFSCASIREVKKAPGKGGEIMVSEGIGGDARADAKQKMKENCGSKTPVIVEEGEAVIGASYSGSKYSLTERGDSEDKREWRIKYKCKKKKAA